jgi:hypothetical protein
MKEEKLDENNEEYELIDGNTKFYYFSQVL